MDSYVHLISTDLYRVISDHINVFFVRLSFTGLVTWIDHLDQLETTTAGKPCYSLWVCSSQCWLGLALDLNCYSLNHRAPVDLP